MNDRTKIRQRANRRLHSNSQDGLLSQRSVLIFISSAVGFFCGIALLSLGPSDSKLSSLFSQVREVFAVTLGIGSRLSVSVSQFSSRSGIPRFASLSDPKDNSAPGHLAVLNAAEYASLFSLSENAKSNASGVASDSLYELVYFSELTSRYVVFFPEGTNLAAIRGKIEAHFSPNYYVALQSVNPPSRSDSSRDPRELMQWYHEDWSAMVAQRFPLSLDQRYPSLQLERHDEFKFWLKDFSFLKPHVGDECVNHSPMTARTAFAQSWFSQNLNHEGNDSAAAASAPEQETVSKSSPHILETQGERMKGFVLLHDSMPDRDHPDLFGQIHVVDHHSDFDPVHEHGTHTAGVIAAARNQMGIAGVAPGANVYVVPFPQSKNPATLREILPGLAKLRSFLDSQILKNHRNEKEEKVQIVLLAYSAEIANVKDGFPMQVILEDLLRSHDVFVVVPAGNRTLPQSVSQSWFIPSSLAEQMNREALKGVVFPVGASDICSRPAWFSNRMITSESDSMSVADEMGLTSQRIHDKRTVPLIAGKQPRDRMFYAPGQSVYSTLPLQDYGFSSGTSSAAAMAAGIAFSISEGQVAYTAKKLERLIEDYARPMKSGSHDFMIDSAGIIERLGRDHSYGEARADFSISPLNSLQK